MTEFTFEDSIWEHTLKALPENSALSGAELLSLLEGASDAETEEALNYLRQKHITLDKTPFVKKKSIKNYN